MNKWSGILVSEFQENQAAVYWGNVCILSDSVVMKMDSNQLTIDCTNKQIRL